MLDGGCLAHCVCCFRRVREKEGRRAYLDIENVVFIAGHGTVVHVAESVFGVAVVFEFDKGEAERRKASVSASRSKREKSRGLERIRSFAIDRSIGSLRVVE